MAALVLLVASAIQAATPSAGDLLFSVELQDPIVHHLQFSSSIVPGQPFIFKIQSGEVECTISGTIPAPVKGVFSFPVEIDESRGGKMSIKGTQNLELSLNKPLSGGPVASFVYLRTFKLAPSP